jgi:hypothetical protein
VLQEAQESRNQNVAGEASLSADRRPFQTNKRCQGDLGPPIVRRRFSFYLPFKRGAAGQLRVNSVYEYTPLSRRDAVRCCPNPASAKHH